MVATMRSARRLTNGSNGGAIGTRATGADWQTEVVPVGDAPGWPGGIVVNLRTIHRLQTVANGRDD
jgi:hypothetical protein